MALDMGEALRYLGVRGEPEAGLVAEMTALADRLSRTVEPRYLYRVFSLVSSAGEVRLEGTGLSLPGTLAGRMLAGCSRAALLLCTLGAGFETMLRAEQARSMARAVMLDALGSAYVETGCDAAEKELACQFPGLYLTDRFSPGYGDLPLDLQREICGVLEAEKRLGVTVTESLLMNPTKSVTAVIGLAEAPQPARIRGCGYCSMKESCEYRKGGTTCAS